MTEKSRALPRQLYGDPAVVVEQHEWHELGCRLCTKAAFTWQRVLCQEPRNERQQGVPHLGHKCRWFDERQGTLEVAR